MSKRPNFILFVTDQHRADFLGCYGHPILQTPNIDGIAERSVAFDSFYVASPVCMPNRASLMTGWMPTCHGVTMNGVPLSRKNVTFVDLLKAAGYNTALIDKGHLQTFTGAPATTQIPPAREGYFRANGTCPRRCGTTSMPRSTRSRNPTSGPARSPRCRRPSTASTMSNW